MKRLGLVLIGIFALTSFVLAETVNAAEAMTYTGTIIDTACATAHKAGLAEFVKTHPKECALAEACMASGYNIYANGKLYKFDKASSDKVAEFLKKADSKLEVTVSAEEVNGELRLLSIENQK